MVVYNHWTGLVDWTGGLDWWTGLHGGLDCGLTFFVLTYMRPHSPVGLDMMHFSLYKPGLTILSV